MSEKTLFTELELSRELLKAIADMGFEAATPIQATAIPRIMAGVDVVAQSQTGTGKTVAFAVPSIERIDLKAPGPQVMVLCPTRELCIQVAEEFIKLCRHKKGILVVPLYGGQSYDRQMSGLSKHPQIIIATPGRLLDHVRRKTLTLNHVRTLVLDEADEMLDMGFQEDLEAILSETPETRQTVLFSATLPTNMRHLIKRYLKTPENIQVMHETLTVPAIEQSYVEIKNQLKLEALCRFVEFYRTRSAIVFCNTKIGVDDLVGHLQARGYSVDALHGDIKQSTRTRVMDRFRKAQVEILVATDVAARGIDVNNVEIVFNYDFPKDEEDYVHRIGRTGRAGKTGRAITFVCGREIFKLREIQQRTRAKIQRQTIPSLSILEERHASAVFDDIRTLIQTGALDRYAQMVETLIDEEHDTLSVAAALLKMRLQETHKTAGDTDDVDHLMPEKIQVNVGRVHKVLPRDIVGALTSIAGIGGQEVGNIEIQNKYSIVEIPAHRVAEVVKNMQGKKIKGYKIDISAF